MKQFILMSIFICLLTSCDGYPWHCHAEVSCDLDKVQDSK